LSVIGRTFPHLAPIRRTRRSFERQLCGAQLTDCGNGDMAEADPERSCWIPKLKFKISSLRSSVRRPFNRFGSSGISQGPMRPSALPAAREPRMLAPAPNRGRRAAPHGGGLVGRVPVVIDGKIVGIASHGDFPGSEHAVHDEETDFCGRV
jgi:hypothetical protein